MYGCTVDGGVTPIVKGTKGFNQTPNRIDVGQIELTLDVPMAPNEYAVAVTITEPLGVDSTVLTQKTYASGVAKIIVTSFVAGVAADVDFDVTVSRFAEFGLP